ncbi:MAG: glycosyltransferase family 4 protein [Acidimicrobiales bacterium]
MAILPSAFWPAVGGVEELTRRLGTALADLGDQVQVWAPLGPGRSLPRRETFSGLPVTRIPMPLPPAKVPEAPLAVPGMFTGLGQLARAIAEFRPDLLHVQCFGPNGAYATVASLLTRTPLVVSLQGETVMDDHDVYERSAVLRLALRLGLRRASAVTACSAFTLEDARRFGLKPGQGQLVFNGVTLDEPDLQATAETGPAQAPPAALGRYVLALGRVVEKKGFDLLLRAFAQLEAPAEVSLVLGGDGPALRALRDLATTLGVAPRVHFAGKLDRMAVARLMRGAEVFVMPSRVEPFGIVVLEAWREGTAVVATTHGGPPEFIEDGVDGVLADPFDPGALARAIGSLLDDGERRARIARNGQAKVRGFAWQAIASQYREIYSAITAAAPVRAPV